MPLTEKIVWSRPPDLPGVEVLSVENNQRPWTVYHETYTICNLDTFTDEWGAFSAGESEWVYRRLLHRTPAGSLMLLEPGEVHHNTKTPPPCNFSVLLIEPGIVNRVAMESGMRPNPHLREGASFNPGLYSAFFRCHAAVAERTSLLNRQSLLVNCIGALLSTHAERKLQPLADPGRRRLERAREFLEQHFEENIALDQVAGVAGLSPFHFLRSFRREFGIPPHAYQISLRAEKVRVLLKAGLPLHAIDGGFADQSHLIRHFRRAYGVTPGQYATMMRKGA